MDALQRHASSKGCTTASTSTTKLTTQTKKEEREKRYLHKLNSRHYFGRPVSQCEFPQAAPFVVVDLGVVAHKEGEQFVLEHRGGRCHEGCVHLLSLWAAAGHK